ncbi:MAG: amino acid ABC transporter ATP-binding protein [Hyphomicrobiales bacterium]
MIANDKPATQCPEEAIVELHSVNKWFGRTHALREITLKVGRGEKVILCGPSGSGKSTMIRCINRLEKHQEGDIIINGIKLTDDAHAIKAIHQQVGMVFQKFNLFPHLTIMENLTLGPVLGKGMPQADAEDMAMEFLDRVRIPGQAWKYPSQLSGGQQQRVAIARSLMMKPRIMLFDEPTSALDPEMSNDVLDVMAELAREGMTMICVTHEMAFARKVADLIVFMDKGAIVEAAPPRIFFASPQNPRTKAFLNQILH